MCEKNVPPARAKEKELTPINVLTKPDVGYVYESKVTPVADTFFEARHRAIPKAAIEKYRIDLPQNSAVVEARYPYYKDGKHVGNKVRTKDKKFYWEGDKEEIKKVELYGQHLFPPGSAKAITVVEGEYDAPSAWFMLGSRYPVVSVSSAGTALRDAKNNFEYLNSFESIVLCLDNDEVGKATAKKIADLFPLGKVRIYEMQDAKDPNAALAMGRMKQFGENWWKAPT